MYLYMYMYKLCTHMQPHSLCADCQRTRKRDVPQMSDILTYVPFFIFIFKPHSNLLTFLGYLSFVQPLMKWGGRDLNYIYYNLHLLTRKNAFFGSKNLSYGKDFPGAQGFD